MTAADDLVCFAWAVIDLRVDNVDLANVVAHRKELLRIKSVADVLKDAEERQYASVATKLADMLFLPHLPQQVQRSGPSPTGIRSTQLLQNTQVLISPLTDTAVMPTAKSPMRLRSRQ